MKSTPRNAGRGFTLIELLVVIAIIALLMGILLPSLSKAIQRARRQACLSNLRNINSGLQLYLGDYEGYFPGVWVTLPSGQEGSMFSWLGKTGSAKGEIGDIVTILKTMDASLRLVNPYIGGPFSQNAEVPMARCPSDYQARDNSKYEILGSSYVGNIEPLAYPSLVNAEGHGMNVSQIRNDDKMVSVAEYGAYVMTLPTSPQNKIEPLMWHTGGGEYCWNLGFLDGHAAYTHIPPADSIAEQRTGKDYTFVRNE